jgi:hypothetical protein
MFHGLPLLDDGKHRRPTLAHPRRIALHHAQIGTHRLREVDLVDDEQITARDARAPFARHLVTAGHVDDVDDIVGKFAGVVCGQVVAPGLDQQQVRLEFALQVLQGEQVGADILTDGRVRASSRLNGRDAFWGEGLVPGEEFGIFSVRLFCYYLISLRLL